MTYVAKKDFHLRGVTYKKGKTVKVSESIAETLISDGKIEIKKKEAAK